jgi:type I restriction enzyme S subunit
MIADLKPYPAMKDSGVPWLGDVPEHWEIRKLRQMLDQNTRRNRPDLPLLSVVREKGVIKRDITSKEENYNYIPDDLTNYKVVRSGQFAMNKMKAWQGSYGVSRYDGIVSPAYFVFDLRSVGGEFFHIAIRSGMYVPFFTQSSDGVRIGQWDLAQSRMKEIPFFIPSLPEQAAIVRFLDYMNRRIRKYIRAKQKLIKLLEEQKQAIIHHAVTRGLDTNVRLKPSGVEWFGDVPEHWEVCRLRNIADMRVSNIDKHTKEDEISIRLCNYVDVYKNERITKPVRFMSATATSEEIARFRLELDDVLITKDSESWNDIGVPALVEHSAPDLVCGYHLALLRPFRNLMKGGYLLRAMQSPAVAYQFQVKANGVTRYGLSHTAIKSTWLPVPPLTEQVTIVLFLDEATERIAAVISHAHQEINLLREYRTRLVADVVTGKLDVREAAARLHDEPGEPEPIDELDTLNGAEEDAADNGMDDSVKEIVDAE